MNKVVLALILLALVFTALVLYARQSSGQKNTLTLIAAEKIVNLPLSVLQKQMTVTAKAKRGSEWQGMYLSDLFTQQKINPDKFTECTLTARDGMKITIPVREIMNKQAFLTLAKGKKDKQAELKLVMLQDEFEQRWLKYIAKIQLHNPE